MRLVLAVVGENAEPLGRDAKKAFGPEGGTLGRGVSCSWQLPDPTNTLSANHAAIAHNGHGFTVTDTSTNGVYINAVDVPLGRGNTAPLADGDMLYLANYVIVVSIEADPVEDQQRLGPTGSNAIRIGVGSGAGRPSLPPDNLLAPPHAAGGLGPGAMPSVDPLRRAADKQGGWLGPGATPPVDPLAAIDARPAAAKYGSIPSNASPGAPQQFPDPLQLLEDDARTDAGKGMNDDLLSSRPSRSGIPAPATPGAAQPRVPSGPLPPIPNFDDLLGNGPRSLDRPSAVARPDPLAPASLGSLGPPRAPLGQAPNPSSPDPQKSKIIPDHLDFSDLLTGNQPVKLPAAPALPPIPDLQAADLAGPSALQPRAAMPAAQPAGPMRKPLGPALANDLVALRGPGTPAPTSGEPVLDRLAILKERAAQRSAGAPPESAPAVPLAAALGGEELAAFWTALGIDSGLIPPERRQEVLAELGDALREMASGLQSVLAARGMIKNEFHIEQTQIRSGNNNAFKFLKSGLDALRKSLIREHGFLPLAQSVREGFHDIKAHEVAAMVAMRGAVSNVLTRMSPQRLETDNATTGLFGGRIDKAKLWDRFVELHASMVNDIDRTTRAYIADEFARSYNSQISASRQAEGTPK
jgi:type VI secretion system protein